jgi:serine/threonine protein kinase
MSTTDPLPPVCPRCGTSLKIDAPEGLCPRCLAAINFESGSLFTVSGAALPPPPIEEIAPHFPQLEILACLGRGGMGVVYKARQISLDRWVALKLLAPEREMDPEFAERFAREAQALARMSHPHIVTVHDFGQAGGFFYLLMEFVDGANLRHLLQSHKFTPEQALAVVPPLCDALQYAHERGIVHRDIKPENLLMDRAGNLKVADFGLAKMLGTAAAGDERPVGTPHYMAPEQSADPANVDSRADIYALGVVIYELLTGELPGKSFEPPSTKASIDSRLDDVVMRAMEHDPAQRYAQASMLKTEVENISRSSAQIPPTASAPAPIAELPPPSEVPTTIVQPAIAMLVTSLLAIGSQIFGTLVGFTILSLPHSALRQFPLPIPKIELSHGMNFTVLIIGVWMIVSLALNGVAVMGALKMRRLQAYRWAIASAAILIFNGLISLPSDSARALGGLLSLAQLAAGIWGLVVLLRDEVKTAFRQAPTIEAPAAPELTPMAREEALRKVSIPGVGLMLTAALNFLAMLVMFAFAVLRAVNLPHAGAQLLLIGVLTVVAVTLCSVMFIGGYRLRGLQNYPLALTAAILAILTPPGLLIGAVFGIWALAVLLDQQVKSAFQTGGSSNTAKGCMIGAAVLLALFVLPALVLGTLWTSLSSSTSPVPPPEVHHFPHQVPGLPALIPLPLAAPPVEAEASPATDLDARLEASGMILDLKTRDVAFAQLASDAASTGNAAIAERALRGIIDTYPRDAARKTTALLLSDQGLRRDAVNVAKQIVDLGLRDETLQELAKRPSVAPH